MLSSLLLLPTVRYCIYQSVNFYDNSRAQSFTKLLIISGMGSVVVSLAYKPCCPVNCVKVKRLVVENGITI